MKKYKALRIIARINIVMGWLIAALGLIAFIISTANCVQEFGTINQFLDCIWYLLSGLLVGLLFIGGGQLIFVLIDIEANTRATAEKLNGSAIAETDIEE